MAKKKAAENEPPAEGGETPIVNKAQSIRDTFEAMGIRTRPKAVIAMLAEKGIAVSAAQVSNIKSSLLHKKKAKPATTSREAKASLPSVDGIGVRTLLEAKKFVESAGGVEQARLAIEVLAKLR